MTGFVYNPERHEYRLDGRRLPSVTEVTDLLKAYAGIPETTLAEARERGQAIHMAIQLDNEDDLDIESLDLQIVPRFEAWRKFLADTGFRVMGFEQPMCSRLYRYAGTPDLWGEIKGVLWLPDIKATAKIEKWVRVQTAAYQQLLKEHSGKAPKRAALQLRDDGTYRFEPYSPADDARDFSIFNACLSLANWRHHYLGEQQHERAA